MNVNTRQELEHARAWPTGPRRDDAAGWRTSGSAASAEINVLPSRVREEIYLRLVPDRLLAVVCLDRHDADGQRGHVPVRIAAPDGAAWARVELRAKPDDRDPALLLDIGHVGVRRARAVARADQRSVGRRALPSTATRTVSTPCSAPSAATRSRSGAPWPPGSPPARCDPGSACWGRCWSRWTTFAGSSGRSSTSWSRSSITRPSSTSDAAAATSSGASAWRQIHQGFQPGGDLHRRLDDSSPFRRRGLERTARGRSWAIHDGVLDDPWQGVKMFRAPQTLRRDLHLSRRRLLPGRTVTAIARPVPGRRPLCRDQPEAGQSAAVPPPAPAEHRARHRRPRGHRRPPAVRDGSSSISTVHPDPGGGARPHRAGVRRGQRLAWVSASRRRWTR